MTSTPLVRTYLTFVFCPTFRSNFYHFFTSSLNKNNRQHCTQFRIYNITAGTFNRFYEVYESFFYLITLILQIGKIPYHLWEMKIFQEIEIEIETGTVSGVTVCLHRLVERVMPLVTTALRAVLIVMQTVRVPTVIRKVSMIVMVRTMMPCTALHSSLIVQLPTVSTPLLVIGKILSSFRSSYLLHYSWSSYLCFPLLPFP